MSRKSKLLIGILNFIPVGYIFIFIGMTFLSFVFTAISGGEEPLFIFPFFGIIFVFHFLIMALSVGLLIFHLMHVTKNPVLKEDQRLLWVLVLLFAGFIGNIIYWYKYIWKVE